jgi:ABC-type proline/glycine betaine transport system permease subunit
VLDYVADPTTWVFQVTEAIGKLHPHEAAAAAAGVPRRGAVVHDPWRLVLIAFVISGLRPAITTFFMLALIGFMGVWAPRDGHTLAGARGDTHRRRLGFGLGVWASESRTVSGIMRPISDVLQTLPQLVYIIPFIYLMPVSIVPGIVAAVLYAFPVVVRLVERG